MKVLIFIGLIAIFANALPPGELLGSKRCTWGPSYWCSNITAAAGCKAVKHCIQTVWEHQEMQPDTDTVCQTCLSMVKQARDQLESNETQEEIKEVFEGSCKLIPIKIINKECCKLADDFIPELVDTLASEMNPQTVCSVAGLCNSERIDKLLEEHESAPVPVSTRTVPTTCEGCHTVVQLLQTKFDKMNRDQVLQGLLQICGHMSSLSDACSNIVVTYFSEIYNHLQKNLNPSEVCLMAGECSAQFHTHANVEITPMSDLGFVHIPANDDLPCELCEQLVNHLRDLLVANTTQDEFQRVLQGLCKQTRSFKSECLSIVDEYYPVIYKFLLTELNATSVCSMAGICPGGVSIFDDRSQIAPLLTEEAAAKAKDIMFNQKDQLTRVNLGNDGLVVKVMERPEDMQLPIERVMPPHTTMMYNAQVCVFCEYFLHYLQQAITNPTTESKIKAEIDKACTRLPSTVNETCIDFINTYGDAFVALLAQEIDPSTICPLIRACPSSDVKNVEVFMEAGNGDKPKCSLCLFAVTKLEEVVKDKKSKSNIKKALSTLCSHLSGQVREECNDFVNTYTDELVELMIADLTPEEVCVYLKLCDDKRRAATLPPLRPLISTTSKPQPELTNEIEDDTINGKPFKRNPTTNKPECVLCEFVMTKLDQMLKDKSTEEEIKEAVHNVCNHLPKSVGDECNNFVNTYADMVILMLTEALKPSEICAVMKLCEPKKNVQHAPENIKSPQCLLCKVVIQKLETILPVNVSKEEVEKAVRSVCSLLPSKTMSECYTFMDKYDDMIVNLLLAATTPQEICSLLMVCQERMQITRVEVRKCAVCETTVNAMVKILNNPKVDHSLEHVMEKACRALPRKNQKMCKDLIEEYGDEMFKLVALLPDGSIVCNRIHLCGIAERVRIQRDVLLGSNKCTWGPSYWCAKLANAQECGGGAQQHCKDKVWFGDAPK